MLLNFQLFFLEILVKFTYYSQKLFLEFVQKQAY